LGWTLEVSDEARRQLRKLDRKQADRITRVMVAIAALDDPRARGIPMTGQFSGYWRFRVGDYRVIAKLEGGRMTIYVIAIGHRREVYR
jgi:mRNA interferase RelE/StbE